MNGNYFQVAKLLLADIRVDPSALRNYAIRIASERGHLELVKMLMSDPRYSIFLHPTI